MGIPTVDSLSTIKVNDEELAGVCLNCASTLRTSITSKKAENYAAMKKPTVPPQDQAPAAPAAPPPPKVPPAAAPAAPPSTPEESKNPAQ